ncbi:MAG: hypothetical protein ABFS03_07395 [Chloroflexota bacterium]
MKVKDFSPIPYQGGQLSVTDRIKGVLKFGTLWDSEMKSQEIIIRYLSPGLDDSFMLFRNLLLPGFDIPMPLILVGLHGVTLIYNDAVKGIFRAEGSLWSQMSGPRGKYKKSKPNLILRVSMMARAIEMFLSGLGYDDLSVDGILVLTHPGTHLETIQPDIRIIRVDALSRLSDQLAGAESVLDRRKYRDLTEAMTVHLDPVEVEIIKPEPKVINPALLAADDNFNQAISPLQEIFKFTTAQWLLLGAIVLMEVVILVIFLLMIVTTSST